MGTTSSSPVIPNHQRTPCGWGCVCRCVKLQYVCWSCHGSRVNVDTGKPCVGCTHVPCTICGDNQVCHTRSCMRQATTWDELMRLIHAQDRAAAAAGQPQA